MLLSLRAGQEAIVSSTVWPGPAGEEARLAVIVQVWTVWEAGLVWECLVS